MSTATLPRSTENGNLEAALEEEIEFRRRRKEGLGGSDVPAILGFSPYRNALDVYHEKTRPVEEHRVRADLEEESIDQWRGHRNEPDAVALFLEAEGYDGRHESRQIKSDAHPHLRVHVDGTVYADDSREPPRDGTGVIEVKSPRAHVFSRYIEEGLPERFSVQTDYNAAVTGRKWSAMVFFCDHHDAGPIVSVQRDLDPEFGDLLLERARAFWDEHVEPRVPPDPDEWDITGSEEAEQALEDRRGEYEEVDEGLLSEAVEAYRTRKQAKDHWEEVRADAQDWIEEHLDTDAVRTPEGHKLRIIRRDGRTYLDRDQLRDHRPLDRDAFIRAISAGVIRLDRSRTETGNIADVLQRLELDLSRFEREGSPSSHIRVYPNE